MNFLDSFFTWILELEACLENIEDWYLEKRKYISRIFVACLLLGVILILYIKVPAGGTFFLLGIAAIGVDSIIGWKHSVRRWLKVSVIGNMFFSWTLACLIQGIVEYPIVTPLFIVLYLIVWVFLSLISDNNVSLLVNEIISGITTTIFTIGTFLISMALKKLPNPNDYLNYFQTDEGFEQALDSGDILAWDFFKAIFLEMFETVFLVLLPIIGVTALSIMTVKVKEYWLEKNGKLISGDK